MHQLAIDTNDQWTVSVHADAHTAHTALLSYADRTDCTLRAIQNHPAFSSWELITLHDNRPHALATIEPLYRYQKGDDSTPGRFTPATFDDHISDREAPLANPQPGPARSHA